MDIKKRISKHKLSTAITLSGGFLVTFILVSMAFTPLFDKYITNINGTEQKQFILGDEPFKSTSQLGYELLDNNTVFHLWNHQDDYYFNATNGVQYTNHYNEYWTRNVFGLFYNVSGWQCAGWADELTGFTSSITASTNESINITLWKDFDILGYDLRFGFRYYIEPNDRNLTVTPWIINTDTRTYPYDIAFAWKMTDIKIGNTIERNFGRHISNVSTEPSTIALNQTLDLSYTNLQQSYYTCDYNETGAETNISWHIRPEPQFYLDRHNDADNIDKHLYLRWDDTLDYLLKVQSESGQVNAPVTLFINAGIFTSGQLKSTDMYWYDSDWDITGGTPFEFETVNGEFNSLVQINSTHYLNAYRGNNDDGYAVVLKVDGNTVSKPGSAFEFAPTDIFYPSVIKINDTHYLCAHSENGGSVDLLKVDGNTITIVTSLTTGTSLRGYYNNLIKINSTHYLNVFHDTCVQAIVIKVEGDVLTKGSTFTISSDTPTGITASRINDTHYIATFTIRDMITYEGYAVVVEVDGMNVSKPGSIIKYDSSGENQVGGILQINDTHYLHVHSGEDYAGYAVVFEVDGTTITTGTPLEFDTTKGRNLALVEIDDTHYLCTYTGADNDGFACVISVNGTTLSKESSYEFDTSNGEQNSLVKINDTHYLNTYCGNNDDGYAIVLTVDVPSSNTAPTVDYKTPINGTTGISFSGGVTCYAYTNDTDGDTLDITWATNESGSWVNKYTNTSEVANDIESYTFTDFDTGSTTYWWKVYVDDGTDNVSETYHFTTEEEPWSNTAPTISNPSPSNSSTGESLTPTCSITTSDADGNTTTITWQTNESGSWVNKQVNSSCANGTYRWDFSDADSYSTVYYWRVYVDDSHDNVSCTYHFTTTGTPVNWQTISTTIGDGTLGNTISWSIVSNTLGDGTLANSISWSTISSTLGDGWISNSISWQTISDTIGDGTLGNTQSWKTVSNDIGDGTLGNSLSWTTISSTIGNGSISDTITWQSLGNTLGDGTLANTLSWTTISSTIGDGWISNTQSWKTVSDTIGDGTLGQSISWQTVSNTLGNGTLSNTIEWNVISNDIGDGSISSDITWTIISSTIGDGSISHSINWQTISDTIGDGTLANTLSWTIISNNIGDGTLANSKAWQTISDTIGDGTLGNGSIPLVDATPYISINYPKDGTIDVCPCCSNMSFYLSQANGSNINATVMLSKDNSTFFPVHKINNAPNGTYTFCLEHMLYTIHATGHTDETITPAAIDTWYNITFKDFHSVGFSGTPSEVIIPYTGHYDLTYWAACEDADNIVTGDKIAFRMTRNGAEINGSYREVDFQFKDNIRELSTFAHLELDYLDVINFQYIVNDIDIRINEEATWSTNNTSVYAKISNDVSQISLQYNTTYYYYVIVEEYGNYTNYKVTDTISFTTASNSSLCLTSGISSVGGGGGSAGVVGLIGIFGLLALFELDKYKKRRRR